MRFGLVLFAGLLCAGVSGAEDAPKSMPRLTPLPAVASPALDLNGAWRFNAAPPDRFWEASAESGNGWADIDVPGEWVMQGFAVEKGGAAAYVRRVDIPAAWRGQRIKLRFDAVFCDAEVYVNGQHVGAHAGGFTPFEFDVTSRVEPGAQATVALAVRSQTLVDELASASQYAAHSLGGITRGVRLFAVPPVHLASLHVETSFDAAYRDATLSVITVTANQTGEPAQNYGLRIELIDPHGRPVDLNLPIVPLREIRPELTLACRADVPVSAPEQWDAEHPNLYTLRCTLVRGKEDVETVQKRIGFRQVEVRGDKLYVNNRPVKLRGACRHETHPELGRALTPELRRKDAELFRAANVNYIRTSHYPPSEDFIEACDELGLFVEEEAPICWIGHPAGTATLREEAPKEEVTGLILSQILEMIQRDRSHPSVIIWSLANESTWGSDFEQSLKAADKADPTRPKTFHDQAWGQFNNHGSSAANIAVYHYPSPAEAGKPDDKGRPMLFGEYCHLNCYNREELVTDPGVRDAWGRSLADMWERVYAAEGCVGGALWAGIDDVFMPPNGAPVGYGPWGFIDGRRRPKPEYWHVKKVYSPVRIAEAPLAVPATGEPLLVPVANRHDFTNLGELRVDWQVVDNGNIVEWGTATGVDIAPRQQGSIAIRPKSQALEGKKLGLQFTSPRGYLVDAFLLPVGAILTPPAEAPAPAEVTLAESADTLSLTANGITWTVDRRTGLLRQASMEGKTLVFGGPTLMLLPLKGGECLPSYRADVAPLNDTCQNWQAVTVEAKGTEIFVRGRYDEAEAEHCFALDAEGRLKLTYRFFVKSELDPRQMGMVFDLPRACDTLDWRRKAQWSVYPADHIGRPEGTAHAAAAGDQFWALDANPLGTADFRSTKERIESATLRASDNSGLRVISDGRQSTRAWVDGGRIRLLVAAYTNGGGEPFQSVHFAPERKPMKTGDTLEDHITLEFLP